ncbi:hypothetical protein SLA2020_501510 [Shorea laevis]
MMCCCPDPGDGAAIQNEKRMKPRWDGNVIGGRREEDYKGRRIERCFFLFVPPSCGRCCPTQNAPDLPFLGFPSWYLLGCVKWVKFWVMNQMGYGHGCRPDLGI